MALPAPRSGVFKYRVCGGTLLASQVRCDHRLSQLSLSQLDRTERLDRMDKIEQNGKTRELEHATKITRK